MTNALLEINRVKELHRSRELARDENKTLGKRKRSPGTVQNTKTDGRKRTRKNQELSELPLPSIKPQRKKTTTSLNLGKYNLKKIDGNEGEAIVDTIASEFQTPRNLNFKHTSTKDSVDRSLPKRNQKKRSPLNAPDENLDNEFESKYIFHSLQIELRYYMDLILTNLLFSYSSRRNDITITSTAT